MTTRGSDDTTNDKYVRERGADAADDGDNGGHIEEDRVYDGRGDN